MESSKKRTVHINLFHIHVEQLSFRGNKMCLNVLEQTSVLQTLQEWIKNPDMYIHFTEKQF